MVLLVKRYLKTFKKNAIIYSVFNQAQQATVWLTHFMNTLHETSSGVWDTFCSKMSSADNLDQKIFSQLHFLCSSETRSLYKKESKYAKLKKTTKNKILPAILQYIPSTTARAPLNLFLVGRSPRLDMSQYGYSFQGTDDVTSSGVKA